MSVNRGSERFLEGFMQCQRTCPVQFCLHVHMAADVSVHSGAPLAQLSFDSSATQCNLASVGGHLQKP